LRPISSFEPAEAEGVLVSLGWSSGAMTVTAGAVADVAELAVLNTEEEEEEGAPDSSELPPSARTVTASAGGDPDSEGEDTAAAFGSDVVFGSDAAFGSEVIFPRGVT
jgi:hypothetical protein